MAARDDSDIPWAWASDAHRAQAASPAETTHGWARDVKWDMRAPGPGEAT